MSYRRCERCGRTKRVAMFTNSAVICNTCRRAAKPIPMHPAPGASPERVEQVKRAFCEGRLKIVRRKRADG